jgi:hypothetical protein
MRRAREIQARIEAAENRALPLEPPRILVDASPEILAEAERWKAARPGRLVVDIRYA